MVVQHNLSAMNANRNLKTTTSSLNKSTEKLSSGYMINRAGDNAAGLAISEKMRGQIRGLSRASENAQDGISLVQTAEGAMQESQNILHRMRELSVQAANDTNTTDDRSQIKVELEELREELDRIANTTEFNTKKLINGDCSLEAKDVKTRVQEYLNGSWLKDASARIKDAIGLSFHGEITIDVKFEKGQSYVAAMGSTAGGSKFDLYINEDYLNSTSLGDWTSSSGPKIGGILADRVFAHEIMHGVMYHNFKQANTCADWFTEGIAEAIQGHDRSGNKTQAQTDAAGSDDYAFGYYAVSYMRYNTVQGTFDNFLEDMKTMNFNDAVKKYYGVADAAALKTKINTMATNDIDGLLTACHISFDDDYDDAVTDWDATPENIVPNGGGPMAIEDTTTTLGLGDASCKITWAERNYTSHNIHLQIGANAGQELSFSIGNMRSQELIGTEDIDVSSYQAATSSIRRFDGAIQQVSTYRAKLGAVQNRLEHTIANLDTSSENLQFAESGLRDTDMADEMTRYSKNNILIQAGQSMLAQANQSTQGVMSLLQ